MGKLIYGASMSEIDIDDRLLAHLQVAIVAKLRRNEPFLLTWDHGPGKEHGHSSIWISASIPLVFQFAGERNATLNRDWVEALAFSANSAHGLHLLPEPETK